MKALRSFITGFCELDKSLGKRKVTAAAGTHLALFGTMFGALFGDLYGDV